MSTQPLDLDGNPIPLLGYIHNTGVYTLTAGATSTRTNANFGGKCKAIRIYSTEDIYIGLGDSTVTATSSGHFLKGGQTYDIPIKNKQFDYKRLAAIRVGSTDSSVYISELY